MDIKLGNNDVVMYIIVNNDLKMEKGKIASQVGHVIQSIVEEILETNYKRTTIENTNDYILYQDWKTNGHCKKIVLKGTKDQLLKMIEENKKCRYVIDMGLTQIYPNSLTVIGFFPRNDLQNKLAHFKLL